MARLGGILAIPLVVLVVACVSGEDRQPAATLLSPAATEPQVTEDGSIMLTTPEVLTTQAADDQSVASIPPGAEVTETIVPPTAVPQLPVTAPVLMSRAEVGYSLLYPVDWRVQGQLLATDFANGARCESVEVVDFQPPPGSGPGALVLHSFVQICGKPLTDSLTLDAFMHQTYGNAIAAQFQITELDGVRAYWATNEEDTTIFLQTNDHRIQIVSSVVANPDKRSQRLSQVQEILDSFSVVQP